MIHIDRLQPEDQGQDVEMRNTYTAIYRYAEVSCDDTTRADIRNAIFNYQQAQPFADPYIKELYNKVKDEVPKLKLDYVDEEITRPLNPQNVSITLESTCHLDGRQVTKSFILKADNQGFDPYPEQMIDKTPTNNLLPKQDPLKEAFHKLKAALPQGGRYTKKDLTLPKTNEEIDKDVAKILNGIKGFYNPDKDIKNSFPFPSLNPEIKNKQVEAYSKNTSTLEGFNKLDDEKMLEVVINLVNERMGVIHELKEEFSSSSLDGCRQVKNLQNYLQGKKKILSNCISGALICGLGPPCFLVWLFNGAGRIY